MAGHGVIRLGDPTTGGGNVISCALNSFYTVMDIPGAVYGDMATCLKHKGVFPFVECDHSTSFNDRGVVLEGHKLACGCSAISTISTAHAVTPTTPQFAPAAVPASIPAAPGDGDLAQAAYGDPQEWTADTGDGSATPRHVLVTLRIGVFFDGTANNAANVLIGEQCRASPGNETERQTLLEGCKHGSDPSYGNGRTNIARLFDLYRDDREQPSLSQSSDYSLPIYIEGAGTVGGDSDSVDGLVSGGDSTGMTSQVRHAFYKELAGVLSHFGQSYPDAWIGSIQFDVFGFSRGAAAARHFVHGVNQKGMGPLATVIAGANLKLRPGFDWKSEIQISFLGLYDTVVMLGGDRSTGAPRKAAQSDFYVALPTGCANKVVHLTARDEHRMNFPLTSAAPPFNDIPLPGVHADLGGGYLPEAEESVWLSKPVISEEPAGQPVESSRAWRVASKALAVLRAQDPANADAMHIFAWHGPTRTMRTVGWGPTLMQAIGATVRLQCARTDAYSRVTLRIMHKLATKANVPTISINDDDQAYALPDDLKPILTKLLAHVEGGGEGECGLTPAEERMLRQQYLHHSAHWNPAKTWLSETGPDLFFPNRPTDDGRRVIFPNEDGA